MVVLWTQKLEGSGMPALPIATAAAGKSRRPECQAFTLFWGEVL